MRKSLLIFLVLFLSGICLSIGQNQLNLPTGQNTPEYQEEHGLEAAGSETKLIQQALSSIKDIPPAGLLLMPHSGTKSVMSFDPVTGDLLDSYFFPVDEVNLGTPIKLIWNFTGTSMFISDQTKRVVHEYSPAGAYIGSFAPQGGENVDIMSNVRGTLIRPNGNLLVSVAAGANAHSVVEFNPQGEYLGRFIEIGEGGLDGPWDIVYRNDLNDYLVSASNSSGIHRYNANGEFIEMFATGLNFPQQMHLLANGNILVANFSSPAGVYEFSPTGEQLNYYGIVSSLRGVYELGNGNILVTNGSGVHEINRENQLVSTKVTGSARWITHIKPLDIGELFNLQLQASPEGAGSVTGAGQYPEDFMVYVSATPGFFYNFVNWTLDGTEVSDQASFQYQMAGNDVTLVANFAEKDLYTITLSVKENSDDQDPIQDALVTISGFDPLTSDGSGQASMDLPAGTYSATITADGYAAAGIEFTLTDANLGIDVLMTELIIAPGALNVEVDGANALLTWEAVNEREFRWDDGTVIGQLGSTGGTLNTVLGTVYRNDAVLQEMSWYLTDNGGPHNIVKLWVIGLDASGLPDPSNILFTQEGVANIDLQWNTFVFPEAIEAPDGFLIGVSFVGFLGMARDSGVDPTWPFQTNTHYFVSNITSGSFAAVETLGDFNNNFLLRAYGVDNGEIAFSKDSYSVSTPAEATELTASLMQKPIDSGHPQYNTLNQNAVSKAFLGFNVFLNDMDTPFANEISEMEYLFIDLAGGDYTAGVQSVYTTGVSDIIPVDFTIDITYTLTFDVQDQDGEPITDAVITLDGETSDPGVYVFDGLGYGTYSWTVSKEGYLDESGEAVITDDDLTVTVVLAEPEYYNVTFRVHFHNYENFDPATDIVYISGDMMGWATPGDDHENQVLEVSAEDYMIYQMEKVLAEGSYEYKYYLNAGWDNSEWAGDPNRSITVDSDMVVDDAFGDPENLSINVPEVNPGSLKLFPNPASTVLNISASQMIHEVRLINIMGQVVSSIRIQHEATRIDISTLPQGIYLVQLYTDKGVITGKLQISR